MARILLIDDEPSILNVLASLLRKQGHETAVSTGGEEARRLIREQAFNLMLTDIRMEPYNGLQFLEEMRAAHPETPVILLTGYGSIKTAVAAMKGGAFDYVTKPFKVDELMATVERALNYHNLLVENMGLRAQLQAQVRLDTIIANSPSMRRVCDIIERVAPTEVTVLVVGESGTGKEVVARAIHANSRRRDKPFLPINCAALPEPLLESEMFGHVKGAFTGAVNHKEGLFEAANGGTIFLDEIGAMPLSIQAKFLRVLQDRKIRRVGDTREFEVDVRVIAATNEPLETALEKKAFREDLYYRLSVITIRLEPLRKRKEDILPLVSVFLRQQRPEGPLPTLEPEAQRALLEYHWPGNVRELENAVRHALAFCRDQRIRKEDLPAHIQAQTQAPAGQIAPDSAGSDIENFRCRSLKAFLREREQEYIKAVIEKMGGDKQKAAEALRISLATLYRKLPGEET